jgi:quinone-modifying oxidoreductase subunit QmoA
MASIDFGNGKCKTVLVVGGGIAGITTALEAAEAGCEVVLVEKSASLGGRVAGFNQYFPKLCPPSCGLEINYKRLNANPRVTVLTLAELESLSGEPGNYEATIKLAPRYVTDACTLCGDCSKVCPTEVADQFNFAMAKTKAIRLPHRSAYPALYVIERAACPADCHACVDACKYQAINLQEQPRKMSLPVTSVVLATGWAPYDATKIDNLGFGKCANVVTNVIFERLASADGPTHGKILRPSDGKEPKAIAFVQCAGSRDQNHLPYCSTVCCTASLKQATYVRSQYPEAKITMFYIDLRTPGYLQEFGAKVAAENGIELIKGKVGKVQEHPVSRDLQVLAEDVLGGRKIMREYDLVVLATGMVPQTSGIPVKVAVDEFGFAASRAPGVYAAGCVKRPAEVSASIRDATGAALKAFQIAAGAAHHG